MTNSIPQEKTNTLVRIFTGILAGFVSSYVLNQCSLHGVDFKTMGVDSEIVKSGLEGTIVGFLMAPKNLVYATVDGILFVRFFFANVWKAIRYGKKVDENE
jgi:hypothetical protein